MVTVNQLLFTELCRAGKVPGVIEVTETSDDRREQLLRLAAEAEAVARQGSTPSDRDICLCIAKLLRQLATAANKMSSRQCRSK
jgi:hypothetical protein